eukprot:gene43095-53884_t
MKVAVVTPYFKEDPEVLRQCRDSVLSQSHPCHHILVADSHPQSWIEKGSRTEHVVLPRSNGDNWFAPSHVASLVRA